MTDEKCSCAKCSADDAVFPADALEAVRTIIRFIGDDPQREGLKETPERVLRSFQQMYAGYKQDAGEILRKSFGEVGRYDQMIVLGPVEFWSTCEHHMLPFFGTATVGYLPGENKRVVGISKLARIVDVFARRLQIQERMTSEIAEAIKKEVSPSGVGVVLRARHLCMVARGVSKQRSLMTTAAMIGTFRDSHQIRSEFMGHIKDTDV